jgi:hypothetical protein
VGTELIYVERQTDGRTDINAEAMRRLFATMGKIMARNAMKLGDNGFESGPVERMSCPESRCCPQPTSGIKVTVERTSQIHT